jgi:hypothetical protein
MKNPPSAHDASLGFAETQPRWGRIEREFFIDNLLVRIHFIIEMIWWTGLAPWEFEFSFPGGLISTLLGGAYMSAVLICWEVYLILCLHHSARARTSLWVLLRHSLGGGAYMPAVSVRYTGASPMRNRPTP